MPKEVVTPQVVANWFANKRKELRRRSNEGDSASNTPTGGPIGNTMVSCLHHPHTGLTAHLQSFSECGSTPSPLTDSNGATPAAAETPMDTTLENEQRSAAEDFLNARPFIPLQHHFNNANSEHVSGTQLSPTSAVPSSLMSLLNLPVHSSTGGTSTGVSPSSTDSLPVLAPSCSTESASQDLMTSMSQNGVLSFINSFYANGFNPQKLNTAAE